MTRHNTVSNVSVHDTSFGITTSRRSLGGFLLGLVRIARPKQWTKNLVLFAGLLFSGNLLNLTFLGRATAGAIAFTLASATVYVFNDLRDREHDREHPKKKYRPIASGLVRPGEAGVYLVGLLIACSALSLYLGPAFALTTGSYLALNAAYTLDLKRRVILDVFCIAAGFVLRAVAGAVVIGVPVSPWLLATTALLSLFLGFSKRRHEIFLLENGAGSHRQVLEEYSTLLLDQLIAVVTSATLITYAVYSFTVRSRYFMLTIPFVAYGLFRYLYLVYRRDEGGSPERVLLGDWPTLINVALWAVTSAVILYIS